MKIEIEYRHKKKFIIVQDRVINIYGESSNGKTFFLTKLPLAQIKIDNQKLSINDILYIGKLTTNFLIEPIDYSSYNKKLIIIDGIDDVHRLKIINSLIDTLPDTVFIIASRCFIRENIPVYKLDLTNSSSILNPFLLRKEVPLKEHKRNNCVLIEDKKYKDCF